LVLFHKYAVNINRTITLCPTKSQKGKPFSREQNLSPWRLVYKSSLSNDWKEEEMDKLIKFSLFLAVMAAMIAMAS